MDFNKEEWVHLGQWIQPTLSACFWNYWAQQNTPYPFSIEQMDGRLFILHGHHFVRKSDVEILRAFVQRSVNDFELLKVLEQWVDDVHYTSRARISTDFRSLKEAILTLQEVCGDIVTPWIFFLVMDCILEEKIREICAKGGYNFDEVVQTIKPLRKSFTVLQSEEAAILQRKIQEKGLPLRFDEIEHADASLAREIQDHVRKFEFVGVHHFVGEPYTLTRFLESKPLQKKEEATLDITDTPQELTWYLQLASLAAWARTHMAETSGYLQHTAKPFLLKVNAELGLNDSDYLWLTATELLSALDDPSHFVKPNLLLRKEKVGIYSDAHEREIVLEGGQVDNVLKLLFPQQSVQLQPMFPLKGRIASQGKVIGIVRIVLRPEDSSKLKEGDILVAPETSPDFIVALKRAKGVITNQGGITSHAAIVSRELGIPCLVSVRDATTHLKDFQRIELDAFKGEVRILN